MERTVSSIRAPEITPDGILFLYSPNLGIRVRYGSLVIDLGRGRGLKVERANQPRLKRLVIAGHGWWTFEVLAWVAGIGASWIHLDLTGRVLGSGPGYISPDLPALRRAQACAPGTQVGMDFGAELLAQKIRGQAAALSGLAGSEPVRHVLLHCIELLPGCSTAVELRTVEARAAASFWEAVSAVSMKFIPSDQPRVPAAWLSVGRRASAITGSPRGASTPAHAIWNFAYSIGAAEVEVALRSVGLDPGISATGLHADTNNRSAATWDVLEAIRGDIDRLILAMIAGRRFYRREFAQLPDGRVRLSATLARELAQAVMPVARQAVAPVAESAARTLAAQVAGSPRHVPIIPTSLSGDSRSRGRKGIRKSERKVSNTARRAFHTLLPPACRRCGVELDSQGRGTLCKRCLVENRREHMELLKASGPAALKRFRESGDTARKRATRAKIGRKTAANNAIRAAWRRAHPSGANVVVYEQEILPYLATISAKQTAEATSLSRNYASTIKSARVVPHERHWDSLRRLIASPSDTATGGRDEHGVSRPV